MVERLIVIAGPTASGKTQLAIALAKRLKAPILSADARKIYKYLNIGTAKPPASIRKQIPFYFIDLLEPTETYSAFQYQKEARALLQQLNTPYAIVEGGTGLYIKALLEGIVTIPQTPKAIREKIQRFFKEKGLEGLQTWLATADPKAYQKIDIKNPRRIQRALEVKLTTGKSIVDFWQQETESLDLPTLKVLIQPPKETLEKNIRERVLSMWEQGLLQEVQTLLSRFPEDAPAFQSITYKECIAYLKDEQLSEEEVIEMMVQSNRRYAKRQRTWLKKYFHADLVLETPNVEAVLERIA